MRPDCDDQPQLKSKTNLKHRKCLLFSSGTVLGNKILDSQHIADDMQTQGYDPLLLLFSWTLGKTRQDERQNAAERVGVEKKRLQRK